MRKRHTQRQPPHRATAKTLKARQITLHKGSIMKKIINQAIPILAIYPFLIIIGFFSSLLSNGALKPLFWFNPPSIVFEEMFEKKFPIISNSIELNLLFVLLFWGLISAAIVFTYKITNKYIKA
jgi:uncharacterized membrane protein